MPKLRTQNQEYFSTNIFNKDVKFVNLANQPTYIQSRVLRIKSKEPETIDWIAGINPQEILFDVGANIGIYTVAAGVRNIKTICFEPHAGNYNVLCQNISINNFDHCVAYNLGLSNNYSFGSLGIKNYYPGIADNVVGKFMEQQHGIVTKDLDGIIQTQHLPQPDHIKIDIDGHEEKFYQGAKQTLSKCKSILFEIENQYDYIVSEILDMGFNLVGKHKRNQYEYNYIFSK